MDLSRVLANVSQSIDRSIGWSRLPLPLAVPVLVGHRYRQREDNLFDTGRGPRDLPPLIDPASRRRR